MKREEFDKKVKNSEYIVKNDGKVALAKSNGFFSRMFEGLGKKVLLASMAFVMAFSGLALSACNDKKPPEQENPPIVDPSEPEKPGPEEPEKPGPEEPEKPDPEEPEKPGPEVPDKTPEEIQKEKEEKIAQNIYAGIEDKLNKKTGGSTINKIMAIDYGKGDNGSNYVYTLLEITSTNRHLIELYRFPMETEMTEENILSGNVKTNKYDPTTMLSVSASTFEDVNSDTSKDIYKKIQSEKLIESQNIPIITTHVSNGGGSNSTLGGFSRYILYSITENEIEKTPISVKSDTYETNAILDNLINGELNKTFTCYPQDRFYHKFSDNALVDYEDGLNYQKKEATITIDGKKVGTYNNGRVYIHFEEENE